MLYKVYNKVVIVMDEFVINNKVIIMEEFIIYKKLLLLWTNNKVIIIGEFVTEGIVAITFIIRNLLYI